MIRKICVACAIMAVAAVGLCGCAENKNDAAVQSELLIKNNESGNCKVYVETDSTMFHMNETTKGIGTLTINGDEKILHMPLVSQSITRLFVGSAKEAKSASKDDPRLLKPVTETVKYKDGTTEKIYAFDIPVSALNEGIDIASYSGGQWYNNCLTVHDYGEGSCNDSSKNYDDNVIMSRVDLKGGTGRASITSPSHIIEKNGAPIAVIEWSSPYYDYMIVDGKKHTPINTDGNSMFEIPFPGFDVPTKFTACTSAMGTPHEIEYEITFKR